MIQHLNDSQITKEFASHIVAFSIAEYGAQGEPGILLILTDEKKLYEVNIIYDERKDKIFQIFTDLSKCINSLENNKKALPNCWRYTNMGSGNHLFMVDCLDYLFHKNVEQNVSPDEVYANWIEITIKLIDDVVCKNKSNDKDSLKKYQDLVARVKDDYRERALNSSNENDLVWCDLCNEINLWTYWQGRGNTSAKILLVGQDWGCAFDEKFDKFKKCIERMNAGDDSANYTADLSFATDKNLIELFYTLGDYDLTKKNDDLFFTNLALGYRRHGSVGGLQKKWLSEDAKYLRCLVNILKPQVILCLGKDTYEIAASTLRGSKFSADNFYAQLDSGDNYCEFSLESGQNVRIYGLAHCGSYGVMNRKNYSSKTNIEDGLELQKQDWEKIKNYLS